jgi:hypothetical protein
MSQKQQAIAIQAKSNIQSLIEQCDDLMSHEMKGIEDGRQDVCFFLLET